MSTDLAALLAAIEQAERDATPKTVVHSGPYDVPNCIGPSGTGDCNPGGKRWQIESPDPVREREHELSHANPRQRADLRRCAGDRKIVALLQQARDDYLHVTNRDETQGAIGALEDVVEILAENYRQEQKP